MRCSWPGSDPLCPTLLAAAETAETKQSKVKLIDVQVHFLKPWSTSSAAGDSLPNFS